MALFFFLFLSLFIGLFVKGLYNRTHGKEYGKFYGFSLLSLALLMILTRIPERQDETEVVVEEQEVIEEPEEESEHPVFEQKVYVPPQNDEKEVKEEPKERTYSWIINTNTLKVHTENCRHVDEKKSHFKKSELSPDELKKKGYTACGTCKPF